MSCIFTPRALILTRLHRTTPSSSLEESSLVETSLFGVTTSTSRYVPLPLHCHHCVLTNVTQLGTGKRSNLSTPQHLPPLPYPGLTGPLIPDVMPASGTLSPMPHSRLQRASSSLPAKIPLTVDSSIVAPEIKVKGHRIEETIVAGDGGSAVYWRILDP
jgi:hypothetical protein